MGRPPKEPSDPAQALAMIVDSMPELQRHEAQKYLRRLRPNSSQPNWAEYLDQADAWLGVVAMFGHQPGVLDAAKTAAMLLRSKKDGIKEWYEHERVEQLEALMREIVDAIWTVIRSYVTEKHQSMAKQQLDAAVAALHKRLAK